MQVVITIEEKDTGTNNTERIDRLEAQMGQVADRVNEANEKVAKIKTEVVGKLDELTASLGDKLDEADLKALDDLKASLDDLDAVIPDAEELGETETPPTEAPPEATQLPAEGGEEPEATQLPADQEEVPPSATDTP